MVEGRKRNMTKLNTNLIIHHHDPYSLRKRRCFAIADKATRAAFPMHLKISAMHGGDESQSSKALPEEC